jgi:hypothetical protein
MKQFYLLLAIFLAIFTSFGQVTKRVYFIGNSYTYYNNLPNLIEQVAASTNDILNYEEHTPGGSAFQDHVANPSVISKIENDNWDYVVLQEQSQRPALSDSFSFPYALGLSNKIKKANACSKVLFFMTWGYKNGDQVNCNNGLKYMCTYEGMDDKIYDSYIRMAKQNQDIVSPVGKVWRTIRERYPAIDLYSPDNSHPSYIGSMAAAYTFYTMIFKKDPTQVAFNGTLSTADAVKIKDIVKEIVFNNLKQWTFTKDNTVAKFGYESVDTATVKFLNQSTDFDTVHWDFGDNTSSSESNPTHVYTNKGEYTVILTVTRCGESFQYTEKIVIDTLSLDSFDEVIFSVYPNPTTSELFIVSEQELTATIFDMSGKQIETVLMYQNNQYSIDVRFLSKGAYWLQLKTGEKVKQIKFLKK